MTPQTSERALDVREVCQRTGLTKPTIRTLILAGDFPEPIQLAPRRIAWLESEISAWMAARPRAKWKSAA